MNSRVPVNVLPFDQKTCIVATISPLDTGIVKDGFAGDITIFSVGVSVFTIVPIEL
jgi:hypothetical protein